MVFRLWRIHCYGHCGSIVISTVDPLLWPLLCLLWIHCYLHCGSQWVGRTDPSHRGSVVCSLAIVSRSYAPLPSWVRNAVLTTDDPHVSHRGQGPRGSGTVASLTKARQPSYPTAASLTKARQPSYPTVASLTKARQPSCPTVASLTKARQPSYPIVASPTKVRQPSYPDTTVILTPTFTPAPDYPR